MIKSGRSFEPSVEEIELAEDGASRLGGDPSLFYFPRAIATVRLRPGVNSILKAVILMKMEIAYLVSSRIEHRRNDGVNG